MMLGDGSVQLRAPTPDDVEPLARIWLTPEVAKWWPNETDVTTRERIEMGEPGMTSFVIEVEGEVAGFLQVWEEPNPEYRYAGIDLMLSPAHQGRGIGPQAIRLAARWAFDRGHHRITIDPAAANLRARRAYEKVGFQQVGILRRYELDTVTGEWRDGVLYDLLPEDLT